MTNPLLKRLPRELTGEIGKYIVIFLFMTLSIGFVSGFLVAGNSMIVAYDESFEKYNIEDGHFESKDILSDEQINKIEEQGVTLSKLYWIQEKADINQDNSSDCEVRIFTNRTDMNKVCVMEGTLPAENDEIALDRMFCANNKLNVGDYITINGKDYKISGLVALSDYSALFSDVSDLMFDAVKFSVGIVSEQEFFSYDNSSMRNCYAWKYNNSPKDDIEEKEMSDEFMVKLATIAELDDYVPRYINSAINFTGDDMGGDRTMIIVLLYMLIIIMAFVFAVTTNHTIIKESSVIGTLRAMGYTKVSLLIHYICLPILVALIAALVGNVLGYTMLKDVVVNLYYSSYSLPTYTTIWNGEAFVLTTIIPIVMMLIINVLVMMSKLKLSPLKFIRHDLTNNKKKKVMKLPNIGFFSRFRIRVIAQNIPNYAVLLLGIFFANIILLFGLMMRPLLSNYQDEILDNMPCKYQYILKAPVETSNKEAEKYSVQSLKYIADNFEESINVYGIENDSSYIQLNVDGRICVSQGIAEKYNFTVGDTITLREEFGKKEYDFKIDEIVDMPGTMSIYVDKSSFNELFNLNDNYFNGYFSNVELNDIEQMYIAGCVDDVALTKTSRQLEVSMGKMFDMISVFSIMVFIILMYMLTKIVIEKNANSISMVKILGYNNMEIAKLYIISTTVVVIASLLITMAVATVAMEFLYKAMMKSYAGWLTMYIAPSVYIKMFIYGILSYIIVAVLQFIKIKNIKMDQALKNVE